LADNSAINAGRAAHALSIAIVNPQPRARVRLGTRGSRLALVQANQVRARLLAAHAGLDEAAVEVVVIRTSGDRIQDRTLAEVGGKGLFSKEIEDGLLACAIDIAVHSMKDLETALPDGLAVPCVLTREDARDAFIGARVATLAALPEGAVVGSASLRRCAQLLYARPDLEVKPLRGNVETRLDKLAAGEADAIVLALAGLNRLGLAARTTEVMDEAVMLPAVAQGAIAIECRAGNEAAHALLVPLNDADTMTCVSAERAMLAVLDGSCRTPIAGHATLDGGELTLRGRIIRPDGSVLHEAERTAPRDESAALGRDVGEELLAKAGPGFFNEGAHPL
jgi:hydroxymethylbilane synthase